MRNYSGALLGVVVAQTSHLDCGTIGQKSLIGTGAQVLGKLAIGESAWV
jgi:serine acetyltransferase